MTLPIGWMFTGAGNFSIAVHSTAKKKYHKSLCDLWAASEGPSKWTSYLTGQAKSTKTI